MGPKIDRLQVLEMPLQELWNVSHLHVFTCFEKSAALRNILKMSRIKASKNPRYMVPTSSPSYNFNYSKFKYYRIKAT